MCPEQQKLIDEKQQLDIRIATLRGYTQGVEFLDRTADERGRLHLQLRIMQIYSDVLAERIEAM